LCRAKGKQKLKDSLTVDGMEESTPISPREAIQQSLELLFMSQIRPRVIKASHVLPRSFHCPSTAYLYIHESYQLDFTNVIANSGNLEDKDKDDTGSQILGSAESEWQDSTMSEAEADLDLLAHDLDSEFGDSSGAGGEILDDRLTEPEPDILVF
jgi:hypothetical protein